MKPVETPETRGSTGSTELSRVNDPQLCQRSAPFSFYLRQKTSMTASQRHLSSLLTRLLALVIQQTLGCKLEHGDLPQEGKLRRAGSTQTCPGDVSQQPSADFHLMSPAPPNFPRRSRCKASRAR